MLATTGWPKRWHPPPCIRPKVAASLSSYFLIVLFMALLFPFLFSFCYFLFYFSIYLCTICNYFTFIRVDCFCSSFFYYFFPFLRNYTLVLFSINFYRCLNRTFYQICKKESIIFTKILGVKQILSIPSIIYNIFC